MTCHDVVNLNQRGSIVCVLFLSVSLRRANSVFEWISIFLTKFNAFQIYNKHKVKLKIKSSWDLHTSSLSERRGPELLIFVKALVRLRSPCMPFP